MENNIVTVFKEVDITEDEKLERSLALVKELTEIDELNDELKSTVKNYKTRIDVKEMHRDELMQVISTGKEERAFRTIKEKDYKKGVWKCLEVSDDGEITTNLIKEIPMTPDEMQRSIDE